jgi:hypothetical protein
MVAEGVGLIARAGSVEWSDRTSGTTVVASVAKDGSVTTKYVLVSVTVDDNKHTIMYINGEKGAEGTCVGFGTNDFILNHQSLTGGGDTSFAVASFRIYNRALTQQEIKTNLECEQLSRKF